MILAARRTAIRMKKIKAVEEIGQKLQMTPVAVNKKLTSLRTQYSRLVKRLPSGSGIEARTPHQKWLVEKLEFIRQHVITEATFDDNFSLYFDASLVTNKFQAKPLPFSFA